jgi:protein involved in ribonucleotide reduction
MERPKLIYFSSVTENTKIFVEQLEFESTRIPLRNSDPEVLATSPYVLVIPTYGGGRDEALVPKQVMKFLRLKENRDFCVGVIGGGNILFGDKYAAAADLLGGRLGVPVLARFEIRGMKSDVVAITKGLNENWTKLLELRGHSS